MYPKIILCFVVLFFLSGCKSVMRESYLSSPPGKPLVIPNNLSHQNVGDEYDIPAAPPHMDNTATPSLLPPGNK